MAQTLEHNKAITTVTPVDIPLCDVETDVIQQLEDEPNDVGGLSAAELKERFDHVGSELKTFLNDDLIPKIIANDLTEQERAAAEGERIANEQERVNNENGRVSAETERVHAEVLRVSAEDSRSTSEESRVSSEQIRTANEAERISAEQIRQWNEAARQNAETGYVAQAEAAATRAKSEADRAADIVGGDFVTRTELAQHTGNGEIHVTAEEKQAWSGKQDALTFDTTPTKDSNNPVTSDGVADALETLSQKVILPEIVVTTDAGASVTAALGGSTVGPVVADEDGSATLSVDAFGTWTLTATKDGNTATNTVEVTELRQYTLRLAFFAATITVTTPIGTTVCVEGGGETQTATNTTGTNIFTVQHRNTYYTVTGVRDGNTKTAYVAVTEAGDYAATIKGLIRYGFKIAKNNSDPATRVEYMYDAAGLTPAYMDYTKGEFNYGDWADKWFVKDNKPLMLKYDGTVDYYLNPDNYEEKEDGTASDIKNTAYGGNGMAQIPLGYVNRYEDSGWEYTIFSDGQYDENYLCDAHLDADGNVMDYFYHSLFGGHVVDGKLRSMKGFAPLTSATAQQEIDYAVANGALWYTGTWSRYEYIVDLCILMCCTTDLQTATGNGFHQGGGQSVNQTGTLSDKGQFFGYNDSTHTVKRFHCEFEYGQWIRLAGLINNNGVIYTKMNRTGQGYRVTDVTGYTNTGITIGGTSDGYLSACSNGVNGRIPKTFSGSGTTYYCDGGWFNNSDIRYLFVGADSHYALAIGGPFAFDVHSAPSNVHWAIGAGLTCDMPKQAA